MSIREIEQGKLFEISVSDSGKGISVHNITNILESFGKNLKKSFGSIDSRGAGLGLTISNYLAKGLGKNKSIYIES